MVSTPRVARIATLVALAALGCSDDGANPCDGITCAGRGYCFLSENVPFCGCMPGYHTVAQTQCEPDDVLDPCRGVDCLGHGSCRITDGGPTCDCDPGYAHVADDLCALVDCGLLCVSNSGLVDGGSEADACTPAVERCDRTDNDCDGLTDEDFDLDFDLANCGACGVACRSAEHGSGTCILGDCAMLCEPGWSDLDGDPANGCEATCTPGPMLDESICEGRDNDCDGHTDEDWVSADVCGFGPCQRESLCYRGETRCRPRVPPSTADDTCDGIDDDCDGLVDDECPVGADADADADADAGADGDLDVPADVPPPPVCGNGRVETGEECDDGNDDETDSCLSTCRHAICGDGFVHVGSEDCDGDGVRSCTTICGTAGTQSCVDCLWDACMPPAEVCNGLDDDCVSGPDNGFDCAAGAMDSCTTSCGSTGSRTCDSSCSWGSCNPPSETCNGADDDCDGTCDDGYSCCRGSSGSCTTSCGSTGTRTCSSSCAWGSCNPPSETCNGVDDDCDGTCDDGYSCCRGSSGGCTASNGCPGSRTCSSSCSWGTCVAPLACTGYAGTTVCSGTVDIIDTGCSIACRRCTCNNGVWTGCSACSYPCPV